MSTQTETAPIDPHWTHSERLMQPAFEELAKGERVQASEKAWGAVAHMLKAIADERGLTYERYSQARDVLRALLAGVTDPIRQTIINGGFAAADNLHIDYFEEVHRREDLDWDFDFIQRAIALMSLEQGLWMERHAPGR